MTEQELFDRFRHNIVMELLGLSDEAISECYIRLNEPHRFYHTLNYHIDPMLQLSRSLNFPEVYKDELDLAILWHDYIWDPRSDTNEGDSTSAFLMTCKPKNDAAKQIMDRISTAMLETEYKKYESGSTPLSRALREIDFYHPLFTSNVSTMIERQLLLFKELQIYDFPELRSGTLKFLEDAFNLRGQFSVNSSYSVKPIVEMMEYVTNHRPKIGIYAGSFNPFHIGHMDILEQAEKVFDKVIVVCAVAPDKGSVRIDHRARVNAVKRILPFHEVVMWDKLLMGYIKQVSEYADVSLVRGLRNGNDLQHEQDLRQHLFDMGQLHTTYFLSDPNYQHISSSGIRELDHFNSRAARKYRPTKYQYAHGYE